MQKIGNSYTYVKKQAQFAIAGLAAMIIISNIDYRKYEKLYKIVYIVSLISLLLVPLIGYEVGGAKRWINVAGLFSIQPSEAAKIGMIMFFATYLSRHKDELGTLFKGFIKPLALLAPLIFVLLFFQTHLSASIVIIGIICIMMLIAGTKFRYFATFGSMGLAIGGGALYILAKYFNIGAFRLARLTSFLDPWADPRGDGWQVIQSLYAIGSGGLFGAGLGNSKQKYLYISEPHNDFIFSVLAEEIGFIGCFIVILLFAILIWRGVVTAMKAPDMFGTLVAAGITALIGIQVIINIAVVTSLMPVTGMPLPFLSYGGTSLLILLCSVGVLLNISRHGTKV